MKASPVIAVVGAGAVGGIIAAVLHKNKHDITLVAKTEELASFISKSGLKISGNCGEFTANVPTVSSYDQLHKKADIVLIATKSGDLGQVAKEITPNLKKDTLVVSLQNGIVEEELSQIVGIERTVGCVVGWGATMHDKGVHEMTSSGEFVIGYMDKEPDEALIQLANILSEITKAETSDQILEYLYSKLIINACISTLGAVSGLYLGQMLKQKSYRQLFLNIIEEAMLVANAIKLKVPPYAGKLDYYKLLRWSNFRKNTYLKLFGFKYRKLKSSSLQSLERGKKTEVYNFNGYIAMKGQQYNVKTPFNARVTAIIMEIESGNRKIAPENINDIMQQ